MKPPTIKLLDCTLRDGGYYNAWDFKRELVEKYLAAVDKSGIQCIEVGFRGFPSDKFFGAYAYSSDLYIKSLNIPQHIEVGVMLNAKDVLDHEEGVTSAVAKLFARRNMSPVDFVRVAIGFDSALSAERILSELKVLGYDLCLNLMQCAGKDLGLIKKLAAEISKWGMVDTLYFADSLGNMDEQEVSLIVGAIREGWNGKIGIHAHNNKGKALSNTLKALEEGVSWIDSTILGMGRGAGNAQTECLLLELENKFPEEFSSSPVSKLSATEFFELQQKYKWGPSYFYHAAAMFNIHPTYIQEILDEGRYSHEEILELLAVLKSKKCASYDESLINSFIRSSSKGEEGDWSPDQWCESKEVLILGSGETLKNHRDGIELYIKNRFPSVISINIQKYISQEYIDFFVACNRSRIIAEVSQYDSLIKPLILPLEQVPSELFEIIHSQMLLNYGMEVRVGSFEPGQFKSVVPNALAFTYAIAIAIRGGAEKISLVGFDGYESGNPRQEEMIQTIAAIKKNFDIEMVSLTPTSYPVKQGSIYAI